MLATSVIQPCWSVLNIISHVMQRAKKRELLGTVPSQHFKRWKGSADPFCRPRLGTRLRAFVPPILIQLGTVFGQLIETMKPLPA